VRLQEGPQEAVAVQQVYGHRAAPAIAPPLRPRLLHHLFFCALLRPGLPCLQQEKAQEPGGPELAGLQLSLVV